MGRQTEISIGVCDHLRTEEVKTAGGDTIAIQCKGCTIILAHVGLCDGICQSRGNRFPKKLTYFVQRWKKRFCTEDCWKATQKAKKKAEEEGK